MPQRLLEKLLFFFCCFFLFIYLFFQRRDGGDQRAKKVVSLGLVDFVIRLVNSVLYSPDVQVNFLWGRGGGGAGSHYRRTVINAHEKYFCVSGNDFWANTC